MNHAGLPTLRLLWHRSVLACGIALAALCGAAPGVVAAEPAAAAMTFGSYLNQVAQSNLELAAQRANVPIAEAQVAIARVFPDPVITGGVSQLDVSGQAAPTVSTLGVTLQLELGGKRGARIAAASADTAVVRSELDDFLRRLRADAASAYIDALYARKVLERKKTTLASLERLVTVNEQRLNAGDIGEVALIQSRVEAQRYQVEVSAAAADVLAADLSLVQFLGRSVPEPGVPLQLGGELRIPEHAFDAAALITAALARPDVRARQQAVDAAAARVRLSRANRWVDFTFNVSWQRSLFSEPFASPAYDALAATLSLPLPLSRVFRGELAAAVHTELQAASNRRSAELRAEIEVRKALSRYEAAVRQVRLYTQGVLVDADRVLAATLYSYQRGAATLLEVLNAQRTVADVYLAYYGALADNARHLIAVEQAAGIWDIDF